MKQNTGLPVFISESKKENTLPVTGKKICFAFFIKFPETGKIYNVY